MAVSSAAFMPFANEKLRQEGHGIGRFMDAVEKKIRQQAVTADN